MKKRTHESFIEELKEKQPRLYNDIEIISQYDGKHKHILVKDKYGICRQKPDNLLYGKYPSIVSAIDVEDYFLNMVKATNPKFLEDIKSLGKYNGMLNNIEIETKYGICEMLPTSIVAGCQPSLKSCRDKIGYIKAVLKDKFPELYDKLLDYGEYEGYNNYLKVKTKYGWCNIKPTNLLYGKCPSVKSAIDRNEYFKNRAVEVHGDRYNYSKINYTSKSEKICIICPEHNEFWQSPDNHLYGYGCEICGHDKGVGGYNKTNAERNIDIWQEIDAKVYVVKCSNENELFYKIGITTRFDTIDRFKHGFPYNVDILYNINTNLYNAVHIESFLHDKFNSNSYKPTIYFGGWTECFSELDLDFIENECDVILE